MKKDDKRTIIVVSIVCVICVTIIFFFSRKSNVERLAAVDDYATYFSVTDIVDEYIDYLSSEDEDNLLNILYSEYIVNNNINDSNVLDYLSDYPETASFSSNNIYSVNIGKNYLYYVTGKIIEIGYNVTNIIDDNFKIVILNDVSNNSYSIYPVDGSNYENVINSIKRIKISNNSSNKMIVNSNPSDVQICKIYFSNFTSKLLYDINDAYGMLSDDMKKEFTSAKELEKFINDNISTFSYSSKLCNKKEYDDSRVYTVIDENDNVYYFNETGVMNYTVRFYLKSGE